MIRKARTWRIVALVGLTLGAYACSEAAMDVIELTPPDSPQLATDGTPNKQDWKQCQNDQDLESECSWVTGNLNATHNVYREGDFVPKALRIPNVIDGAPVTLVMTYGFLKGGLTTHDFLGRWDATMENANPCTDGSFAMFCTAGDLNAITATSNSMAILSQAAVDAVCSPQHQTDMAEAIAAVGADELIIQGVNVSLINVTDITFDGCPASGDAEATLTMEVTPNPAGESEDGMLLLFGAHVARGFDWENGGAAGVSGSPYHLGLISLDGKSAGSMDLQMAANAIIVPGTIIVEKQTIPDGSTEVFNFDGPGDFDPMLTDGQTAMLSVAPGTYTVTETEPGGWDLTNITCDDGDSSGNTETGVATYNVAEGEVVKCTFTNTGAGSITIVKNAVPDGPTDFSYTGTGPDGYTFSGGFSLDDDADGTLPNQMTFSNLVPGSYSVVEGDPAPAFTLTNLVCSDESDAMGASTTSTTTRTASISLEAGESVTCTYTNTQGGSITIVKNTVPDGATDFGFTGSGPDSYDFDGGFSLDDDADGTLPNQMTFSNLVPGAYSVVEGASTTHNLTNLVCSDESDGTGASTTSTTTRTASISLEAGESVTCTYTNTEPDLKISISPLTGTNSIADTHTLTATAEKDPDGDGVFEAVENGITVTFAFEVNTIGATFVGGTNTCATAGGTGQCSVSITSSSAGQVTVSAAISLTIGSVTLNAKTGTGGNNSANATKDFLAGSLIWEKRADSPTGALIGGATFEVCRTRDYDPATMAFTDLGAGNEVCFSPDILDNDSRDQDTDNGQFQLINLILGTYRITEKIAPTGFILDPTVRSVDVTSGTTSADGGVWVNLQTGDVCEDGKPRRLIMLYTGNGTADDGHDQETSEVIIRVDDDLPLVTGRDNPVAAIRTYDHRDMPLDTFDDVEIGDLITFQNNGNKLVPSRAGFRVFLEGANINDRDAAVEHVQFHSSCSQPLAPGDEFGSFFLLRDEN